MARCKKIIITNKTPDQAIALNVRPIQYKSVFLKNNSAVVALGVLYLQCISFLVSSEFLTWCFPLHLSINDRMNFTNRTTRMARVILATRKMRTIRILVLTFFVAFWSCHFQVRLWSRIFSQSLDQHSATQSYAKPNSLKDKPLAPLSAKRSQAQTPKGLKQPPQSGRCHCRFDQFNSMFIQIC